MRHGRSRGIGLLEVAVSLMVITSATVSVLSVVSRDFRFSHDRQQRLIAQTAARRALDFYARVQGYNWISKPLLIDPIPYVDSIDPSVIPGIGILPAWQAQLFVDNWYSTGPVPYRYEVLRVTVVISWTPPGGTTQSVRMATLVSNEGFDAT